MQIPHWLKPKGNPPVATDAQHQEPVRTDANQCDPYEPIMLDTIHAPKVRAALLVEALIDAGLQGKSIYHGDLQVMHDRLCTARGWAPVSWLAICRAMKALGLRKCHCLVDGERLTMYEIQPIASNVTPLRKQA